MTTHRFGREIDRARTPSRFVGIARVVSSWLVVVLVSIAAWYVLRMGTISESLRGVWYLLVALSIVRAVYGTYRFLKRFSR